MEGCQSGLICSLGKRVYLTVPRVRIPLLPPLITNPPKGGFFVNLEKHSNPKKKGGSGEAKRNNVGVYDHGPKGERICANSPSPSTKILRLFALYFVLYLKLFNHIVVSMFNHIFKYLPRREKKYSYFIFANTF